MSSPSTGKFMTNINLKWIKRFWAWIQVFLVLGMKILCCETTMKSQWRAGFGWNSQAMLEGNCNLLKKKSPDWPWCQTHLELGKGNWEAKKWFVYLIFTESNTLARVISRSTNIGLSLSWCSTDIFKSRFSKLFFAQPKIITNLPSKPSQFFL